MQESELCTRTFSTVPRVRYFCAAGPFILSWNSLTISMNSSGLATVMSCVPRVAMALRFFEPMMAPSPVLPAALVLSLMMHAIRESFSPAMPIAATRM